MPQNLFNCRDLGGLKTNCQRQVRKNQLLRSGNLGDVTPGSADYLVEQKNVGTYIDFRAPDEVERFGKPTPLIERGVEWINLHIDTHDTTFIALERPLPEDWAAFYVRLFEKNLKTWIQFVKTIKEAPKAVIYGCLFGKDRTGIATSLLLSQLNVRDQHILEDYARTTQGAHPHYRRLKVIWEDTKLSEEENFKYFMVAHPEIIESFLGEYRSRAANELKHILSEIGDSDREELQTKLLETI